VLDADGAEVGHVRPPTEAPKPQPGPIYSIDIPNLHIHAGVVPVDWEPPLFVVGQLRGTAFVTQGNSVLVGHLRGAAGYNVFDHLDKLAPGDKVIASSRGETYDFVVSQVQVLPEGDTSPTESTSAPRLTLMTCAGTWNPLTQDYSDRLWVIAEPADSGRDIAAGTRPPPAANSASAHPMQVSPLGGLGNTDADLVAAFGPPVGESANRLAVYRVGHRAQLADVPGESARRAVLVADVPPSDGPLTFDAAVTRSRGLLPNDAQPRAHGPEGNQRFIVERFTSPPWRRRCPLSCSPPNTASRATCSWCMGVGQTAALPMSRSASATMRQGSCRACLTYAASHPDPGQSVVYRMIRPSMQPLSLSLRRFSASVGPSISSSRASRVLSASSHQSSDSVP